jgi:hypothetical protein
MLGIGGGIITSKLLFAVMLVTAMLLTGIAGVSAANVGHTETKLNNSHIVPEKVNYDIINIKGTTKSDIQQNKSDKTVKYIKKTVPDKQIETPNKNTSKHKVHKKQLIHSKNLTKTSDIIHQSTANSTSKKSTKTANALKQDVTANSTKNTELQAAAGETKNIKKSSSKAAVKSAVTSKNFTVSQINSASARVNKYIENKHRLPKYVTIGTSQVKMPAFLKLLTADIIQLNNGKTTPIKLKNVKTPSKTTESFKSGKINKSSYLGLAKRVDTFINKNGVAPKQTTSNLGKMNYKSLIYTFSKIPAFYKTHKRLPGHVSVKKWSTSGTTSGTTGVSTVKIPASLKKYVKATKNCQINNARIKSLSKQITRGKKTQKAKAVAIFNWVRNKIGYKFYYNTRKGAVGTLNARSGNCVDTAHLLIALERAAGIPARYIHGKAKFRSGKWYGHVWAGVYVNGKWYKADATSSRNSFGVIKNWSRAVIKGKYASLPF